MAKAKKDFKLGVNAVVNMVSNSQYDKIDRMVSEKKLTNEAVRYVLDNMPQAEIIHLVMMKYSFNDIFSSYEDYIKSKSAERLFETGDANYAFDWIDDFPSNEELIRLYKGLGSEYLRKVLYKNVVYRERTYRLNLKVRDKYTSCFDSILEMTKIEYNEDLLESLKYMLIWCSYISKEWIEKCEDLVGVSETRAMVEKRMDMRMHYFNNIKSLYDLEIISEYIEPNRPEYLQICLVSALSPLEWCFYEEERADEKAEHKRLAKRIYNRFLAKVVKDDLINLYRIVRGSTDKIEACIYILDDSIEMLDKAFLFAIKKEGISQAVSNILYLERKVKGLIITPTMEQASRLYGRRWKDILLTKPILNADELIKFKDEVFPFSTKIDGYADNPFAIKNIQIGNFSKEDIDKIADLVDWDNIRKYFKNDFVPFDFVVNNKHRLNEDFFTLRSMRKYTCEQLLQIIEMFESKFHYSIIEAIIGYIFGFCDGLTTEKAAELLKKVHSVEFFTKQEGVIKNTNLDLQSILTLL